MTFGLVEGESLRFREREVEGSVKFISQVDGPKLNSPTYLFSDTGDISRTTLQII